LRVLLVVLALAGSRAARPVLRAPFEGSDSSDKAIAQLQQAKAREVAKAASAAQQANTAIEAARRSTSWRRTPFDISTTLLSWNAGSPRSKGTMETQCCSSPAWQGIPENNTPELVVAPGLDGDELKLVGALLA
jgi:hypothetical protein